MLHEKSYFGLVDVSADNEMMSRWGRRTDDE